MEVLDGMGKLGERRLHVGMRIIKTVVAVFLCGVLPHIEGQSAFYSMIAALLCIQNSTGKTIETSANRALGTLIGGAAGVLVVCGLDLAGVLYVELVRYFVSAIVLIPIIEFTLLIKKPQISGFACVVFLCITINHSIGEVPAVFALERMLETLIGVAVACAVDAVLPHRAATAPEGAGAEPPKGEGEEGR